MIILPRPGVKGVPIIPIKKPSARLDVLIGAGKETLTPGLILGKDAL